MYDNENLCTSPNWLSTLYYRHQSKGSFTATIRMACKFYSHVTSDNQPTIMVFATDSSSIRNSREGCVTKMLKQLWPSAIREKPSQTCAHFCLCILLFSKIYLIQRNWLYFTKILTLLIHNFSNIYPLQISCVEGHVTKYVIIVILDRIGHVAKYSL